MIPCQKVKIWTPILLCWTKPITWRIKTVVLSGKKSIIYLPRRVKLLLLSATIPNADEISSWISSLRGDRCIVIESDVRPVPLFPLYLLPDGELVALGEGKGINKKIFKFLNTKGKSRFKGRSSEIDLIQILKVLEKYNLLPAVFFLKSRMDCNNALKQCRERNIDPEKSRRLQERVDTFIKEYPFISKHPNLKNLHGKCFRLTSWRASSPLEIHR